MKVILLRDVAKIGRKFSIVEVPDGYALNRLIPKKDAEPATPANVKRVMSQQKSTAHLKESTLGELQAIAQKFTEAPLRIAMEANEQGHLFQAVHAGEIVSAAQARGVAINAHHIHIINPIKSLGLYTVELKAEHQTFSLAIEVVPMSK